MQHASDSKHCRRCGAAYVYDAIYLGHLGRYHCPSCGQRRPEPDGRRRADRAARHRAARSFMLRTPAGSADGRRCRCPASTTSTTRSARPPCAWRSASRWSTIVAGLERGQRRVRAGRADRHRRARALDPADQEPGRRQRDPAHAGARARRARPAGDPQRPHRRRPRRLLDLGRRLRAAGRPRARGSPAPARAPPSWRCGSSTPACPPSACTSIPTLPAALDQALGRGAPSGRLFALPTYTALLELREELAAARACGPVLGRRGRQDRA